jgi:hypothetical protein
VSASSLKPTVPRCEICGEPVGVYEPLVKVDGERVCRTSRAAAPDLSWGEDGACYHARCFDQGTNAGER